MVQVERPGTCTPQLGNSAYSEGKEPLFMLHYYGEESRFKDSGRIHPSAFLSPQR